MLELVYCSVAKPGLTQQDISDILNVAQKFNSKNNLTGCLIYYEDEFVQILEGEEKSVKDLYRKIQKDDRHSEVTLISEEEQEERTFSDWNMAYFELDNDHLDRLNREVFVNNLVSLSDMASKPTETVELFWSTAKVILTST